jgi:ubiquitin carboxyl-terminal hydrolase 22/27/51
MAVEHAIAREPAQSNLLSKGFHMYYVFISRLVSPPSYIKPIFGLTRLHLQRFSHSKDKSSKLSTRVKFPLMLDMAPYTTLYADPETFMSNLSDTKKPGSSNATTNGTTSNSKPSSSASDAAKATENGTTTSTKPKKPIREQYEALLACPKESWPINLLSYSLSAVIVHKGEINSGHYINYCREGTDWFLFDDSKVVLVGEKEVLAAEAYLLLYVIDDSSKWAVDRPAKNWGVGDP